MTKRRKVTTGRRKADSLKTKRRTKKIERRLADQANRADKTYAARLMKRRRALATPAVKSKTPKQVIAAAVEKVMADRMAEDENA